MDRRGFFSWLSSLAVGTIASQPAPQPEPCITPAYAGFDGTFVMNGHSRYKIKLARAYADHPKRWSLSAGMLGVWRNRDESVSKVVWRSRDGKLFDLQFVPMEEPT
jgi:hypothetical protein